MKKEKIEEKQNNKAKDEKVKTKSNKLTIVLKVLILILAVLIILEVATGFVSKGFKTFKHFIFRTVGIEAKEGNSIGNINNYGYMAEDDKYLYYMCPNENGQYIGISKVKKDDLTGPQTRLIEGTWEITGINSYGDYIYFTTLNEKEGVKSTENSNTVENTVASENTTSPENVTTSENVVNNTESKNEPEVDEIDNKIHRIRKNGDQKDEIINDNEFNNYSYKISVVGGKVYYIGEDECIWYMDLDGKNKTKLNDNATGFEAINDKYILYNMPENKNGEESSVSYIMNRNGKKARKINGERIFTPIIHDDKIYYLTEDRYVHKMDLDGKNDVMLSDSKIYNLNVSDDGIFYFDYVYSTDGEKEGLAIYRMDLDGKNNKRIYTLRESSNALCLVKNWVFFLDSTDEAGYMEVVSKDGKQKIDLYKLNYSDYYYKDELIEESENASSDENTTGNVVQETGENVVSNTESGT